MNDDATDDVAEDRTLRQRTLDVVEDDWLKFLALGALVAASVASTDLTWAELLDPPIWLKAGAIFGGLAVLAGWIVGTIWYEPETPDWYHLYEINADDPRTPTLWEITPEKWSDLTTIGGRPEPIEDASNAYKCRFYAPQHDVAHVTWDDIPSDSDLLGTKPSQITTKVAGLRDTYEDTHGRHQWVLDHLYAVVRRLDFKRTQSQNQILEDNVSPSMNDKALSDHVDDIIPSELQPDQFDTDDVADDEPLAIEDADDARQLVDDIGPDPKPNQTDVAADGGRDDAE